MEELRQANRQQSIEISQLNRRVADDKRKPGQGKAINKKLAPPLGDAELLLMYARRAAAVVGLFLNVDDLTRDFSPEDRTNPKRWESDDAKRRGITAALHHSFGEKGAQLWEALRNHVDTQKFVSVISGTQCSAALF